MNKKRILDLFLASLFALMIVGFVNAEIRINEIELDPFGDDSGNEWIEIYSSGDINISNCSIINSDNQSINIPLNIIGGYYLINLASQWLDNTNETIRLYNGTELVFQTPVFKDSYNDNRTWQYCNGQWNFTLQTLGKENNCTHQETQKDTSNEDDSDKISIEIEWDEDDIVNGQEFEIKVKAYNLSDKKYNIKIWIEDDDKKIISERYDEENDEWKSGNYYVDEFFQDSGDDEKEIKLRIKGSYEDFKGDAVIHAKLEGYNEIDKDIEILEKEETEKPKEEENKVSNKKTSVKTKVNNTKKASDQEVIVLGNKQNITQREINETSEKIVYVNDNEKIKKYSIYAFAFFCLVLCVLLISEKLK